MRQSDDHLTGFIFYGRQARHIHFLVAAGPSAHRAISVGVRTIGVVELAGGRVTDAKTGGIFDDDPGVKQASKFDHPDQQKKQDRQYKSELKHALSLGSAPGGTLMEK